MEEQDLYRLRENFPLIQDICGYQPVLWVNEQCGKTVKLPFGRADIDDAEARLKRFAPYILAAFPETAVSGGIIESPLKEIPFMKEALMKRYGNKIAGRVFLKCDNDLAVSGSIKARGGIYEVLKLAERIATEKGLLTVEDGYGVLREERFRELFSKYRVAVGSTGNLGLSIGIISAVLGFDATVHMSSEARQWKKDLLRSKGVTVLEYPRDYQTAVAEGRREAARDGMCHFVDDEGSRDLFLGYSVAALRIAGQFEALDIVVDEHHPAIVYLPCGVGGAPGGVAFGLKQIFGKNIHCVFAEPTHAPCMLLAMMTGLYDGICVSDVGLDGRTAADGLAVGRASGLVSRIMDTMVDACYTVTDEELYPLLAMLADTEGIYIEPSACAGFPGLGFAGGQALLTEEQLSETTHIVWATGGSMVPEQEMAAYYKKGKE